MPALRALRNSNRCGVDRMSVSWSSSETVLHRHMKDEVHEFLRNFGCSYVKQEDATPRLHYEYPHWFYGSKKALAIADVFAIWHGFKIWVEVGDIETDEKLEALREWEKDSRNIFVWIPYRKSVKHAMEELSNLLENIPKSLYREIPPPKPFEQYFELKELSVSRIKKLAQTHGITIQEGIVRVCEHHELAVRARKKYEIPPFVEYWGENDRGKIVKPNELSHLLKTSMAERMKRTVKDRFIKEGWKDPRDPEQQRLAEKWKRDRERLMERQKQRYEQKRAQRAVTMTDKEEKEEHHCEVCSRKISKEECEAYDGLCWECWDDQMTEECEFEEDTI